MVTDTIKKVANAILDAGEGCQSGLVYVDPVEAAKAAIAVLSAEECSYNAGFNDGWEAANGDPPEAELSAGAEPVAWGNFKDDGTLVGLAEEKNENWIGAKPLYVTPPAPSFAVKALEWNDDPCPAAESILGHYVINKRYAHVELLIGYGRSSMTGLGRIELNRGSSIVQLKEAAQADYESRIRAALSAQVQDVAVPSTDMKALQSWVYQQRVSLQTNDPEYFAKYGVWKAVGAQIRDMLSAAPAAKQQEKP